MTRKCVLLLAWIGVACAGCPGKQGPPEVAMDRVRHEFRPEYKGETVTTFELRNVGGKQLSIENVQSSCGCTVAELAQASLAPGEGIRFPVRVSRPPIGRQESIVSIFTNATDSGRVDLQIVCWASDNTSRIVHISPARVFFPIDSVQQTVEVSALERPQEQTVRGLRSSTGWLKTKLVRTKDQAATKGFVQRTYTFQCVFENPSPGHQLAELTVLSDGPAPGRKVPVEAVIRGPVDVNPDRLFARIQGDSLPSWTISVEPNKDGVQIRDVGADCDWLTVESPSVVTSSEGPSKYVVRVVRDPGRTLSKANVVLRTNGATHPVFNIPVVVLHP